NALWTSYQTAITNARKLKPDAVATYAATLGDQVAASRTTGVEVSGAAAVALKAGLVTGVKSRQDGEKRVIGIVGEDQTDGSFNSISSDNYIRVVRAEQKIAGAGTPKIGVIVAAGDILDGDQPPGSIGGSSTARLIREARLDDNIKAVVLRV